MKECDFACIGRGHQQRAARKCLDFAAVCACCVLAVPFLFLSSISLYCILCTVFACYDRGGVRENNTAPNERKRRQGRRQREAASHSAPRPSSPSPTNVAARAFRLRKCPPPEAAQSLARSRRGEASRRRELLAQPRRIRIGAGKSCHGSDYGRQRLPPLGEVPAIRVDMPIAGLLPTFFKVPPKLFVRGSRCETLRASHTLASRAPCSSVNPTISLACGIAACAFRSAFPTSRA
jgi:hypothetical protein